MKRHLLKVLGINDADIARAAGVTRQAISKRSPRVEHTAAALILAASRDPLSRARVMEALGELQAFLDLD